VAPRFRRLGIAAGLAQGSVQAIAQDPAGYMWFGTQAGLQRYDGYGFVDYRHDPGAPGSLAGDDVDALAVTVDGAVWVGTGHAGLDLLRPGAHVFRHYRHEPHDPGSLAGNAVLCLLIDRTGRLWVGTGEGLDRLQPDGTFRHYRVPDERRNANEIFSLFQDRSGRIWVGTDHGVYVYAPDNDGLERFRPDGGPGRAAARAALANAPINTFARTSGHRFWIGTEHGLALLSTDGRVEAFFRHRRSEPHSLSDDRVRGVLQDRAGTVWVATYGGGISRFEGRERGFANYGHDPADPASLSGNAVFKVFQDATGLVWIGTDGNGLDIYDPQARAFGFFRHNPGDPDSLADDFVWSIYEGSGRALWVGTDEGLTRIGSARRHYADRRVDFHPAHFQDDDTVNAVAGGAGGALWLGTDYGLFRYPGHGAHFRHYSLEGKGAGPDGGAVNLIFRDRNGRFWVGTLEGLVRFDPGSGRVLNRYRADPGRQGALPAPAVTAMCQSAGGGLWVGTVHGLRRFHPGRGRFVAPPARPRASARLLADSNVLACRGTPDGSVWIGTKSGLIRYRPGSGTVTRYTEASGLPSDTIYTILRDAAGDIWTGTGRGLARLTPGTGRIRGYDRADGLSNEEFNQGAAFAGADGTLYFGGVDGVTVVHPQRLGLNRPAPHVAITDISVAGTPVPLTVGGSRRRRLRVNYRQNVLTFRVAVLDFAAPGKNVFRYKLEGFDSSWHALSGRHTITYTNLDPGHYDLRVRGADVDGTWSKHDATLAIRVLPPPWQTWWAWLAYAAAIVVILAAGLRLFALWVRRRRDFASEQRRRRWAEALYDLVQAVSRLEDEPAIAEQLVLRLPGLLEHDCAVFYMEDGRGELAPAAIRGFPRETREALSEWPRTHAARLEDLRRARVPQRLRPEEAASLEGRPAATRGYLALPFLAEDGGLRLLVAGRAASDFSDAELELAGALGKQMGVALDKARLIGQLEGLATTDSLTRVYNRRFFMDRAEAEFERSRRYGRSLSVVVLDADNFKSVNDNHGHAVGDDVLRAIVNACRRGLREPDMIGRYGGEEFVMCLPETSAEVALEVAERLRRNVARLRVAAPTGEVAVTVSLGVASSCPDTGVFQELVQAADRALYEAKRRGRNRVQGAG